MRDDIINGIQGMKGVTNVLVLTFNIDFLFIQTVLFTALRKCGNPSLTILGDAECLQLQYEAQSRYLSGLGRRYRVIPVRMEQGFRFHPKAILLSADEKARLYLGSGNCTYAGWRQNAEIWQSFDTETDSSVFLEFRAYLNRLVKLDPEASALKTEISACFNAEKAWVKNLVEGESLLISHPSTDGLSLFSQMQQRIRPKTIRKIIVSCPYFDEDLHAIGQLADNYPSIPIDVMFNGRGTNLSAESLQRFPDQVSLRKIRFLREDDEKEYTSIDTSAFIHGKFYAFLFDDDTVDFFAGSANCSTAALLLDGKRGNAELLVHQFLTLEELENEILKELVVEDQPPVIHTQKAEEVELRDSVPKLHIQSAQYEYGSIHIRFLAAQNCSVVDCFLDGKPAIKWDTNNQVVRTEPAGEPKQAQLRYRCGDHEELTGPMWIDYEHDLSSLSARRNLTDLLVGKGSHSHVAPSFFLDVIRGVEKELQDVTLSGYGYSRVDAKRIVKEATFTFDDLRSKGYEPSLSISDSMIRSLTDNSFADLLLRFMMHGLRQFDDEPTEETQEELEEKLARNDHAEVQHHNKPSEHNPVVDLDSSTRNRIRRHIEAFVKLLTSERVLNQRPIEHLRIDIKVAGGLLLTAYGNGWIDPKDFAESTARIWTKLFLGGPGEDSRGWLKIRVERVGVDDTFFMEPSITAMLLAWYSMMEPMDLPEYTHMVVAGALSASHYPGLWFGASADERLAWLESIASSFLPKEDFPEFMKRCDRNGSDLYHLGQALDTLESRLLQSDWLAIRKKRLSISNDIDVHIGDLMWQGKQNGYCISRESFQSRDGDSRKVYCLAASDPEKQFGPSYMLLLEDLLAYPDFLSPPLSGEVVETLTRFQNKLRRMPLPLVSKIKRAGRNKK